MELRHVRPAPRVRDGRHDGDALGWAEHSGQHEIVEILRAHAAKP